MTTIDIYLGHFLCEYVYENIKFKIIKFKIIKSTKHNKLCLGHFFKKTNRYIINYNWILKIICCLDILPNIIIFKNVMYVIYN
jgi:hypothetical protein